MRKKLMNFISLFLAVLCSFTSNAQTRSISISASQQPVSAVLKAIEQKSGFSFFYNGAILEKKREVSIEVENKDVLEILEMVFKGTNVTASIVDNTIILAFAREAADEKKAGPAEVSNVVDVSGTVLDESGLGIIGAAVIPVNDRGRAVVADADGNFTISVKKGEHLIVSALGYKEEEIHASSELSSVKIVLKEDVQLLDEVVVVGYGVQKRSDITGAISSVSAETAKSIPTTTVAEMLRGAAPGIQVNLGSAAPGGSSTILIRGRHSLGGDNTPLYIVDGVPMSGIDDINANDIASIEVLKDASSQSIYGARAANGVILMTTKRGSEGKTKVSYDGYAAVQTISRNFEFYNGEEWAAYRHEAFFNAYGYYDESECFRGFMQEVLNSGQYVDWEAQMIKPAFQQNHNIMVQAGNSKTKIAAALGFYNQNGMVQNSGFNKLSGRINIDQKLGKTVSLGANITYTRSWTRTADGTFNSFVTMPPLAKVYDQNGNLLEDVTEAGESHTNPLWNINNASNKTVQSRLLMNLFLDWNICKGLSYRFNSSMSQRDVEGNSYQGLKHTTGRNNQGSATVSRSNNADYLLENILNYTHDFNKNHHIDATLMQSINVITWKKLSNSATGFPNDDLAYDAIGNAIEYGKPGYELSKRQLVSFLGRARYNLMERYLFTLSVRVDGSSVFGAKNKYGVFPSAAFAWRINNEPFMRNASDWLSNLKLRLSWGQVGNQGISPYTTLGDATAYYYRFGDNVGAGYLPSSTLYNPSLKWETSTTTNIGVDFGFLKDRINGSIELYDTETTDLLVPKSINQVLGYTTQTVNLGRVQNRGIELSLNTTPVSTRNFNWNLDLSFARNVNRIKRISGEVDQDGKPVNDVNSKWFIGYPVNVYYDYKFDGIWQNEDDMEHSCMPTAKAGDIRIADTDEDNRITEKDRVIMSKDPDWIGTLSTGFNFYGFDLSAVFNVSAGGTFYNSYLTTFANGGDLTGKRNGIRRNYWTKYNPSNEAPTPNMTQAPAYISSLGYQDASFLRLRNLTFGYSFKPEMISKARMQSLRLYLSATNLWYYTNVLGYGPEQTPGDYPEPRTILIDLKVSF